MFEHISLPTVPDYLLAPAKQMLGGLCDRLDQRGLAWIAISLVHESFIDECEELEDIELYRQAIAILAGLGEPLAHLVVCQYVYFHYQRLKTNEQIDLIAIHDAQMPVLIADKLELKKFGHLGQSHSSQARAENDTIGLLQPVVNQFMGAVFLSFDYEVLFTLIERTFSTVKAHTTALQLYSLGQGVMPPVYSLARNSNRNGSNHYTQTVTTQDGKLSTGAGSTEVQAKENAARSYFKKFLVDYLDYLDVSPGARSLVTALSRAIPEPHRDAIRLYCLDLNIPSVYTSLVSQALTHPSFLNDQSSRHSTDYVVLARAGIEALRALITKYAYGSPFHYRPDLRRVLSLDLLASTPFELFSATGFRLLKLEDLLLVSKQLSESSLPRSIKAQTFHAVLGCLFFSRDTFQGFVESLPKPMVTWMQGYIGDIIEASEIPEEMLQIAPLVTQRESSLETPVVSATVAPRSLLDDGEPVPEMTKNTLPDLVDLAHFDDF